METGGLRVMVENATYSAERLRQVFPRRYPDAETARSDAGNPETILNRAYAGRGGNIMPDDGWRYRSRGFIALWGRDNYAQVGEAIGVDVLNYPDLATEPETAFRVAIYWFTGRES